MSIFNKNVTQFVWVLILLNVCFIACYFSGVSILQQFIAPTINKANFSFQQMREFGALEMTQNVLLIGIFFVLFRESVKRSNIWEKCFYFSGGALFVFMFLEELDYGLHIYKYISGDLSDVPYFSWHNQWEGGVEKATKLKKLADGVTAFWFVLIPLIFLLPVLKKLKEKISIIPSCWFIASLIIAIICSKIAHHFDDLGFGVIDGVQGNLYKTIAEFRETSMYYLFYLYALQLINTKNPLGVFKNSRLNIDTTKK